MQNNSLAMRLSGKKRSFRQAWLGMRSVNNPEANRNIAAVQNPQEAPPKHSHDRMV